MVEAEGIHKYFGHNHVLRGIDLTVRKGEVVVIVGPSGSGKSTFLRTINHLDVPDRGTVRIDGTLLGYRAGTADRVAVSDATLSEQRRQIGMVFQQFNLFSHMTALDNVMSGPVQVLRVARSKAAAQGGVVVIDASVDHGDAHSTSIDIIYGTRFGGVDDGIVRRGRTAP